VAAKTTARASAGDVVAHALPKARKAPRATGVAVRCNNATKVARVAVVAKSVARTAIAESCSGKKAAVATTTVPPRRPLDDFPCRPNRPLVNGSLPYPSRRGVRPAELENARQPGLHSSVLRPPVANSTRPHVSGVAPKTTAGRRPFR
jgi:hypothetical protein